jgi:hypothetical protein
VRRRAAGSAPTLDAHPEAAVVPTSVTLCSTLFSILTVQDVFNLSGGVVVDPPHGPVLAGGFAITHRESSHATPPVLPHPEHRGRRRPGRASG